MLGVSAPVDEEEDKPKKSKKKSLFAEMMVGFSINHVV